MPVRGELATGGSAHLKRHDCCRTARTWNGGWAKLKRNGGSSNRPKGNGRGDRTNASRADLRITERIDVVRLPDTRPTPSLSRLRHDLVHTQYFSFPACLISHLLPLPFKPPEQLDRAQNLTSPNGRGTFLSPIVLITL